MDLVEDPEIHMDADIYGSGYMDFAKDPEIQMDAEPCI